MKPIAILSGNSCEHALLAMGAIYAGVPYFPLSPAWSLASGDLGKRKHLLGKIKPGLIFAEDENAFSPAVRAADVQGAEVFSSTRSLGCQVRQLAEPTENSVVKVLFTSGSTGGPKGVLNTHRMLVSNQVALAHVLGRDASSKPLVLCDWLPWHHTFGGNHNFHFALANGGTLFIDNGRPTPSGIAETVRNLAEVSPTAYFNVPHGFGLLLEQLRREPALRERFFHRLEILFSGAAAMPLAVRREFQSMAQAVTRRTPIFASGYGSTETAPLALFHDGLSTHDRFLGKPVPGVRIKLEPVGLKYELRIAGPNVMPGYWQDKSGSAFDEDGYFRSGDAVIPVNPADPVEGLIYDGRLSECFKLSSGTWVDGAALREQVLNACAPLVQECCIVGENQAFVAALLFSDARVEALDPHLKTLASRSASSSMRVVRAALIGSAKRAESTEKGSFNREQVLKRHAATIAELYGEVSTTQWQPTLDMTRFHAIALLAASTAAFAHAAPPVTGSAAKDFSLTSSRGKTVQLSELLKDGPIALVVLRGFPGYQCPFCNKQVQDFVKNEKAFAEAGLRVVMIYPGPAGEVDQRANEFLANKNFPGSYEMLLDPDYKFTNLYELRWDAPRETAHPSTFLIGKDQKVLFAKVSDSHGDRTNAAALLETFKNAR